MDDTKEWDTAIETEKRDLAVELAVNTYMNGKPWTNLLTGEKSYDANVTFQDIQNQYYEMLTGTYTTNRSVKTVYHPFRYTEGKTDSDILKTSQKLNPQLYYMVRFRQHLRILRRLMLLTYFRQHLEDECLYYDNGNQAFNHSFFTKKAYRPGPRIAEIMQLSQYETHHKKEVITVEQVNQMEET